jgi:nitrate/TMAO reductase-like tetraheme cytochrome c subunit
MINLIKKVIHFLEHNRFAEWLRSHKKIALALKISLYSFLTIVVMFAFTVIVDEVTKAPAFCGVFCHEMTPEYETFKVSSHNSFDCVDCHNQFPDQSYVGYRLLLVSFVVDHFTGYETPIKLGHTIPDVMCMKCHSNRRQFSPSGDLLIPHSKHLAKGVPCIQCHKGVTHGLIYERGKNNEETYSFWDTKLAEKNMQPFYTRPKMKECMDCHTQRKVANDCTTCHRVITLPFSHSTAGWGVSHAKAAETSYKDCAKCHATYDQPPFIPKGSENIAGQFAQYTSFCYSCHQKRPAGHTADWMKIHKDKTKEKGMVYCSTCHSLNKTSSNNFAETYCNKCHWFENFKN